FRRDVGETGRPKVVPNDCEVIVAVRDAGKETWRGSRKDHYQRPRHGGGGLGLLDTVPDIEDEPAPRLEQPTRLAGGFWLVWKEHRAELTDDGIEFSIAERKYVCIGRPPGDPPESVLRGRVIEHRLVEVGRRYGNCLRQHMRQRPRHDAGTSRGLQQG